MMNIGCRFVFVRISCDGGWLLYLFIIVFWFLVCVDILCCSFVELGKIFCKVIIEIF